MMRAFLTTGACLLVLSACSETAEPEPVAEQEVVSEALAIDGGPAAGTYTVTGSDGTVITQEIKANGTVNNTFADGTIATGTWSQESPEIWCATAPDTDEVCYTQEIDAAGNWTAVNQNDPEDKWTVVRSDG